jgi:hypothetical protein
MTKFHCILVLTIVGITLGLVPLIASEPPTEYSVTLTFSAENGLKYIDALEGLGHAHALKTYDTGSISVAAGVVTLTDGVWPAWAALGTISREGGPALQIATRDSDTQLTLEATPTIGDGPFLLEWTTPPLAFIKEGLILHSRHIINRRASQVYRQETPAPITTPVAE